MAWPGASLLWYGLLCLPRGWCRQAWLAGANTTRPNPGNKTPVLPALYCLVPNVLCCSAALCLVPVQRVGRHSGPKAHVLVCAPSNSALDEIVIRILKSGLMDARGNMYAPSIVRIGVNVHHSVKSVSLDAIVDSRLGVDQVRGGEGGGEGGEGGGGGRG